MANEVSIRKVGNIKEIRITIEDNNGMIIRKNTDSGEIVSVTDELDKYSPSIQKAEAGALKFNGQTITNVFPDDVVIFTHSSPGCAYYWDGRRWVWRCT
jgi:hypothetical protein